MWPGFDSRLMHFGDQRLCCVTAEMFEISWSINKERLHVEIITNIGFRRVMRGGSASKEFQAEISATNVEVEGW